MSQALLDAALRVADGQVPVWPAATGSDAREHGNLRRLQALAQAFRQVDVDEQGKPSAHPCWGHLQLREVIGQGAFGIVHRAFDPLLRREVALKLAHDANQPAAAASMAEARRLARIRHPHVLAIHGAARIDGRVGIWSDLLPGQTLEAHLAATERLDPARVLDWAEALAGALAEIHRHGLIHGDIKPANIMILPDGSPVLMDFGAAREGAQALALAASPLLAAPEIFEHGRLSPASDRYALGVVLYRALLGRYPCEATDLDALLRWHRARRTPSLAGLSADWRRLLGALLTTDPDRRPSADQLQLAVRAIRQAPQRRRQRAGLTVVMGSLLLGLLGTSLAWREASQQQSRAEATTTALLHMLRASRPTEAGRQLSVLDLLRDFRPQMAQWLPQAPTARAQLSQELAQTFLAHGDLSAAAELSAAALTDCGDCPTQVVTQLRMADAQLQGIVALIHGELALAEQHTAVGADLARARYPAGHWRRLDADVRQAEVALARRDLDRLRQWLTPAITDLQRRHWPDPLREAQARNLWLSLLRETGSTAEAEVYARHYVDWADRQFGARHSSTLTAHQGLNLVLLLADKLPEARQRLSADVQLASDWLGPSHATTLGLRLQLATLMARQGEPGSALVALESVRTDLLTQAEPDPEILLVTLGNLASRYKDTSQWAAAEASYAQVIEQATQIYGAAHPRVWLNQANLAELLLQRGRSSAAMALASQVEAQAQDALGPTHRITAFATFLRGRALLQLGEAAPALPVLTQARLRLQAALGAEAGLSLRAGWFLALALKQAGQQDAARDLVDEGLPISLRVLGASHPEYLDWQRLATELNAAS